MTNLVSLAIADSIATITLNDPSAPVNMISPDWIVQMQRVLDQIQADGRVRGILITSAKSSFMAGADLKYIAAFAATSTPADAFAFSQRANSLFRAIERCGKPVVAAIGGFALGGGYELALACSHRILVDDPKAVVGLPEVNVGLLPGAGGTQRLPRLIGVELALDVMLSGRNYRPAEALEAGLVDQVVPADRLMDAARAWLDQSPGAVRPWDIKGFRLSESGGLIDHRTASLFARRTAAIRAKNGDNYPAPLAILTCVFEGVQLPLDNGLKVEGRHFARLLTGPVSRNIIRTMFLNKGAAEKGAHRPPAVPKATVRKLGILGAGMMGAGIAFAAASAGIDVILLDMSVDLASKGRDYSERLVAAAVAKGRMTAEEGQARLAHIRPTADYADLAGCDLVIENVFEDPGIKGEVTRKAAAVLGTDAWFVSNTSTLPISGLAKAFPQPDRFIGLHFFSPADRMPLVEIILGAETGEVALARAFDFVAQIRKTPIVVNDARGFYTSRVFLSFAHEGAELLRDGVAPALIENAAKAGGMPVGPLAVTDEVTLALPIKIDRQAEKEEAGYRRPSSMDVLEKMATVLNRAGRKSGGGYYDYPDGGPKRLWRGLTEHFPSAAIQPDVAEVTRRLLYRQALETVRCLEEGVLTHAADADLGAILGWGFPTHTGGTLSLIDTVGVTRFVAECDALAEKFGDRFAPTTGLRAMAADGRSFHGKELRS